MAVTRAHLRYNVTAVEWGQTQNAKVFVYEKGTTTPVDDLYTTATGSTLAAYLTSNAQGEIEGWLQRPRQVDLSITDNDNLAYPVGQATVVKSWDAFTETIDVHGPPGEGERVYLEHFGAVDDGSTDNAAAFAAADAYALLTGQTIWLGGAGSYYTTVFEPSTQTHWKGYGEESVGWTPGSNTKIIGPSGAGNTSCHLTANTRRVRFDNIIFQGTVKFTTTSNHTFYNCGFQPRSGQNAFDISNSFELSFPGCTFYGLAATPEVQTVTLAGATGGTFTLTFTNPHDGVVATTAAIAYNATAADVLAALEQIASMGATDFNGDALSKTDHITVAGSAGGPYTVTFGYLHFGEWVGQFAGVNVGAMTADGTALTGTTPTVTVSTTTTGSVVPAGRIHPTSGTNNWIYNFDKCHWWHSGIEWEAPASGSGWGQVRFVANKLEGFGGRRSVLHIVSSNATGTAAFRHLTFDEVNYFDSAKNFGSILTLKATAGGSDALSVGNVYMPGCESGSDIGLIANATTTTPNRVALNAKSRLPERPVAYVSGWTNWTIDAVLTRSSSGLVTVASGSVFNSPVRRTLGPWVQDNVAQSQAGVALALYGDTTRTTIPAVRAGHITGLVVSSNAARTNGTLTVEVTTYNPTTLVTTSTGLTAVLDGTNTTTKVTTQNPNADTYAAGDLIGVKITTNGSWNPTTADISVMVEAVE